ncbi:TPA: hypothetical protein SMI51_000158 [Serratia marcescens]|nr:hypothetical protein [Serratia marcescens]
MDKFSEMSHAERIAYLASKVALAKSYDSPVLTVPIPDLEIPLAELEAKDKRIAELEAGHQEAAKQIASWRRIAKQNIEEREKDLAALDAERQKITELEVIRTDASLVFKEIGNELGCNPDNESILMAIDELKEREKRVVALAGGNAELWETMAARLEAAEAKLATPVRLQSPWVDKVGNRWLLEGTTADVIRAAGFAVTVEGDE